jgi:hypothetical protein
MGGALGAAVLHVAVKRKWVIRELDSRALTVTSVGRREMLSKFGLQLAESDLRPERGDRLRIG